MENKQNSILSFLAVIVTFIIIVLAGKYLVKVLFKDTRTPSTFFEEVDEGKKEYDIEQYRQEKMDSSDPDGDSDDPMSSITDIFK